MIVPGYLPVLHFYLYLIVLLSLVSLGQFSFHFQHSPHCGVQSQQKALVGRFQVFTGARLLQSLRPYLAKPSHLQQLISNWPDKLSRSLEGYFRVSCPQAPGIPPLLPSAFSHTDANNMLVSSCWQSVAISLYFGVREYTLSSSSTVNVVHGFLVLLSGYCVFFNDRI